jgi:hypothetical protein
LSTAYESATLLIRLYELRREPMMREARTWFVSKFHATSIDELMQVLSGPNSAHFRMVASYWEMAASFVLNGAIDEKMFSDANGEHTIVYAKLEPVIAEYRAKMGNPASYASLEQLVMRAPGSKERLAALRERFRPR